jgi:hypothetical protein
MTWKNCLALPAIAPRRRVIATALVYGLSLTVRFTSAAGEEAEARAQAAQSTMTSIMINDGARIFYEDWSRLPFTAAARRPRSQEACRY